MSKYVYPCVFTQEENGYSVRFPDIESCYTSGENLQDALDAAQDVLCLVLYDLEETGKPIPQSSDPQNIATQKGSFVTLVGCDTVEYRKFFDNKAVKKTLTIPSWLNTMAEKQGINFSGVLQEALRSRLNV